jgi:hypothetical protein
MYHDSDSQVNITSPWGPSIKVVHLIKIPILIHHKEMTNFDSSQNKCVSVEYERCTVSVKLSPNLMVLRAN